MRGCLHLESKPACRTGRSRPRSLSGDAGGRGQGLVPTGGGRPYCWGGAPHYHGEVATLEEIEARLAAVEQQLQAVRQDAAAARVLAGAADRDVSEFRQALNAHTTTLNALRETQVEHQQETRDGFARVNVGMAEITRLLNRLAEPESGE